MILAEREIARLKDSEQEFDLIQYYSKISVHLGSAAFSLLLISELSGADPSTISFAEKSAGYQRHISGKSTNLKPGGYIRIGRRRGVEIFDKVGNPDDKRLREIKDAGLHESLASDRYISREHTEIDITGPSTVIIRDLGSMNGTIVRGHVEDRGKPQRHLRLVK